MTITSSDSPSSPRLTQRTHKQYKVLEKEKWARVGGWKGW